MTIYMPTILMNIVGHSTMFFKPFFFEAQVCDLTRNKKLFWFHFDVSSGLSQPHCNACLDNNVCQVNCHHFHSNRKYYIWLLKPWRFICSFLFVSVSNDLPRTSYLKMVDIWLIFNLFIPFLEVLLHTYKVSLLSLHTFVYRRKHQKSKYEK